MPNSYQLKSKIGFKFDELVFIEQTDANSNTAKQKNDLNKKILETFLEIQEGFHKSNYRPFEVCTLVIKHSEEKPNIFFIKRRKTDAKVLVLEITANSNTYTCTSGSHKVQFAGLKALLKYTLAKSS